MKKQFQFTTAVTVGIFMLFIGLYGPNGLMSLAQPDPAATDLAIWIQDQPAQAAPDQVVTYTLLSANDGPDEASNVVITTSFSSEVALHHVEVSAGSCTDQAFEIVCSVGMLVAQESYTATIVVSPVMTTTILTTTAVISAAEPDTNSANNRSTAVRLIATQLWQQFLPYVQIADATLVRFAVIGDYGNNSSAEKAVADLVISWQPDFIITLGDNNYEVGAAETIDANIGQYYQDYIFPYQGTYGPGADYNRFFPSLGNHDWVTANAQPYLDYFMLPGNERYYDFRQGPVHLFAIDSDSHEPDGITADSTQGQWLQAALAASDAPWKVVYMHHPPYSSGSHGDSEPLQWPYQAWGATAVMAGHDHSYERITRADFPYFVNGLGGRGIRSFNQPVEGSEVRYYKDYGAMLVKVTNTTMTLEFISTAGEVVDSYTLTK